MYNTRANKIQAFANEVVPFKDGFYQKEESDMADKALPDWIKWAEKYFIG